MKWYKISALSALVMTLLLAACDTDNEGAIYREQGDGVAFLSKTQEPIVVSPTDPTFTVDLVRATAGKELTGTVTVSATYNGKSIEGCTASDYTFAADAYQTTVTVDVSPLEIGQEVDVTLTLDTDDVAIGGQASTSITVSKDYTWQYLGQGYFADNAFFYWYDNGVDTDPDLANRVKVDIYEAAEQPGRYQVYNPYGEYFDATWGADMDGVTKDKPDNILTLVVKDGKVSYGNYNTGMNYAAYNEDIYLYPASSFGNPAIDYAEGKTISLSPMYYLKEAGGAFDYSGYQDVIVITLP